MNFAAERFRFARTKRIWRSSSRSSDEGRHEHVAPHLSVTDRAFGSLPAIPGSPHSGEGPGRNRGGPEAGPPGALDVQRLVRTGHARVVRVPKVRREWNLGPG